MTGLTSGKFLWPKEKSWVLYRTKQAVIGLSFSPGKLPRASFPGRSLLRHSHRRLGVNVPIRSTSTGAERSTITNNYENGLSELACFLECAFGLRPLGRKGTGLIDLRLNGRVRGGGEDQGGRKPQRETFHRHTILSRSALSDAKGLEFKALEGDTRRLFSMCLAGWGYSSEEKESS
ncbi:hypothetical protein GQ457_08G028520 [Hibiscus cannabinus]